MLRHNSGFSTSIRQKNKFVYRYLYFIPKALQMYMRNKDSTFWKIAISFLIIYFVWGSTYLANAWAISTVPPFLLAGVRFTLAGGAMVLYSLSRGNFQVDFKQLKNAAFAGVLLFAVGNGLLVWSLQYIDSGISALIVAFEPLLVVLLMWKMKNDKPKWNSWFGIALGVIGMALLVGQPTFNGDIKWIIGLFAIAIAISAWAYISIWLTDAYLPKSIFQSAGVQMLCGGIVLLIVSTILVEFKSFSLSDVSQKSLLSLLFLIVFGSIIAFTAFNYLLTKVSPTLIVTCTYVNPVVALILGWWLNHEHISALSIAASIILLTGVLFINGHFPGKNRFARLLLKRRGI